MSVRSEEQTAVRSKYFILLLLGLVFSIGIAVTLNRIPFIRLKSDLYQRWYATTKLFAENRNIYDARNGAEVLQEVYGDDLIFETTNFYYPAHLLFFTVPLTLVSYPTAHLLWTTAVQLFYLTAIALMIWAVGWPDSTNRVTLFLLACVLFVPSLQHTIWGQFNTIGILSLGLCYLVLQKNRYGLAGILASGLTFKPQTTALTLAFIFIWVLFARTRWRFYLGFMGAMFGWWLFAELLQPDWVLAFTGSLGSYIPVQSIVDMVWNPYQIVSGILIVISLALFFINRHMSVQSAAFAGCLSLSIGIWALVMPVVGMMHTVMMPLAVVLLMAALQQTHPQLAKITLICLAIVYMAGWFVFVWGLSDPSLYGQHILGAEMIYKGALPGLISLFSLPLCWPRQEETMIKAVKSS
ncbi:MAG: DUF2029 domain-containing protein [Chloroflexi bacterium]|nr:DUF2029 domain-containing protein [Chloroflexota bacterium]